VSTGLFEALLVAFAEATGAGAGAGKLILLPLDNAGWHVSERLRVPEGIELVFLPPYTPELQPAEHLWPLADEAVANKSFATLEELDQALAERCRTLATMPALIHAPTHSDWWPADTKPLAPN
jgi:transposase